MKNTRKNTRLKNHNSHIFTKTLLVAMLTGGFLANSLNADELDSQDSRPNTNQSTNQNAQDSHDSSTNSRADSHESKSTAQ